MEHAEPGGPGHTAGGRWRRFRSVTCLVLLPETHSVQSEGPEQDSEMYFSNMQPSVSQHRHDWIVKDGMLDWASDSGAQGANGQHAHILQLVSGAAVAVDLSVWLMQATNQVATEALFTEEGRAVKVVFERVRWLLHQPSPSPSGC